MDVDVIFHMNSTIDYEDYKTEVHCLAAHDGVFIQFLVYVALVLGLPGNGLIFALLWQKRRSWSVTDTFVVFLSCADVKLLMTLPFWAVNAIKGWTLGTGLCKAVAAIFKMSIYFETLVLACISVHHLLLVTGTRRLFSRQKLWVPFAVCLAVWVVSFLLAIGDWLNISTSRDAAYQGREWCPVPISHWRGGAGIFLAVSIILVLAYSVVLIRLPPTKPQDHKKRRAVRFVLALVAAFFLCLLPYHVALLVDPVGAGADDCADGQRTAMEMTLMATAAFGCLQFFIKPLLFLGLLTVFRTRTLELVKCRNNPQSNHKISMWDSGGEEEEEEEEDSAAKHSLSQVKC